MAERLVQQQSLDGSEKMQDGTTMEVFKNLPHWVCCFCVVTFDLELGQALEVPKAHLLYMY